MVVAPAVAELGLALALAVAGTDLLEQLLSHHSFDFDKVRLDFELAI